MKKTICKYEYDTDSSTVIQKFTFGSFGDADGYEETLYQTEDGKYFIYVNGGEASVHPREDIKRIAKTKIEEWIAQHS